MTWPFAVVPPTSPSRVAKTRLPTAGVAGAATPGGTIGTVAVGAPWARVRSAASQMRSRAGPAPWSPATSVARTCTVEVASGSTAGPPGSAGSHWLHVRSARRPRTSTRTWAPGGTSAVTSADTRSTGAAVRRGASSSSPSASGERALWARTVSPARRTAPAAATTLVSSPPATASSAIHVSPGDAARAAGASARATTSAITVSTAASAGPRAARRLPPHGARPSGPRSRSARAVVMVIASSPSPCRTAARPRTPHAPLRGAAELTLRDPVGQVRHVVCV